MSTRHDLPRCMRYDRTPTTGELPVTTVPTPRCDAPLDDGGRCVLPAGHLAAEHRGAR